MKKTIKILLLLLFVIWLIPAIKNTYLYLTYNHSNNTLTKLFSNDGLLLGEWKGVFDSFPCGIDVSIGKCVKI